MSVLIVSIWKHLSQENKGKLQKAEGWDKWRTSGLPFFKSL